MMITAYKLNGVVIYPESKRIRDAEKPPEISTQWFILPGRKRVHISKLSAHAMKLNQPLEKVTVPMLVPLDMERITP